MAALPYMPMHVKDVFTDERICEMRSEDVGLFMLFLFRLWISEDEIKNNDSKICRLLNISEKRWKGLKEQLMESGLLRLDADGCLRNNRLTKEKQKSFDKSQSAKTGALARWGKENSAKYKKVKEEQDGGTSYYTGKPIIPIYNDDDGIQLN